jgi:hypothetical protein
MVDFNWDGVIAASGKLDAPGGRWLLGFDLPDAQKGTTGAVVAAADADGDGQFGKGERVRQPAGAAGLLFYTAANNSGVVGPVDVAGVIFDGNGDGTRDSVLGISRGKMVPTLSPRPVP